MTRPKPVMYDAAAGLRPTLPVMDEVARNGRNILSRKEEVRGELCEQISGRTGSRGAKVSNWDVIPKDDEMKLLQL